MWICTHKINVDGGKELNSLKTFVRKIILPEGSIGKGYMVYKSMVYITQYICMLASYMQVDHIWDVKFINKFQGDNLLGKGRINKPKGNLDGRDL